MYLFVKISMVVFMINFHKYGFLDVKRLKKYIENKDIWLCRYNPVWLFIHSDTYKTEIAFVFDFCFIRIFLPSVGMTYLQPLGTNLEEGMKILLEDARDKGIEFNMAFVDEKLYFKMQELEYNLNLQDNDSSYIFNSSDLAYMNTPNLKKKAKAIHDFEKKHKNCFYKQIKKDSFPQILEFMESYSNENPKLGVNFYKHLNILKKLMDHLYELDLYGIMLVEDGKVIGVAIGSIYDNIAQIHFTASILNSYEMLLSSFSKYVLTRARFISLEEDLNDENIKNKLLEFHPYKIEKYYSTYK